MKDVIAVAEKGRENLKSLVEKIDKVAIVEVTKILTTFDISSKYK